MFMFVRIAFVCLIVWLLSRMLRRIVRSAPGLKVHQKGHGASVPVFQDPVCGVYLSEAESQIEIFSGKRYYFCSARCRDEFRKRTEKLTDLEET